MVVELLERVVVPELRVAGAVRGSMVGSPPQRGADSTVVGPAVGRPPGRGLARWLARRRAAAADRQLLLPQARVQSVAAAAAALVQAGALLEYGWVQGAWFHLVGPEGRPRVVGPLDLGFVHGGSVAGVCLVGAVVQATGGPGQARSQVTGRALDLLWDALQDRQGWGHPEAAARACAPAVRVLRVRELTTWNDRPGRTRGEVLGLVEDARRRAAAVTGSTAKG